MAWKKTNDQYYSDIATAIRSKNGTQSTYTPSQMAGAISAINIPNAYIATVTIAVHQSANTVLCTLPDEVYAHRNDNSFSVLLKNTTPSQLVTYDDFDILANNNPDSPKQGTYPVYGVSQRKNSDTSIGRGPIYYPPNSTDNTTSLGGNCKIWLNGKILNYKPVGYYLGAGTWNVVVSW